MNKELDSDGKKTGPPRATQATDQAVEQTNYAQHSHADTNTDAAPGNQNQEKSP